jgi:RHS repeat-associated protein
MGCFKLTYYHQEEALEANPFFSGNALDKKDQAKKKRIDAYRYGFNGMERDDEMKGIGNSYDFGARLYDPRLGRWFSVDPEFKAYPANSDYSFALNSVINVVDPDGSIARDPDGNIIFVAAGGATWQWQGSPDEVENEDGSVTLVGIGIRVQKGFVFSDEGKKIPVSLVVSEDVVELRQKVTFKDNGIPVYQSFEPGKEVEGNPQTNCTGLAFTKGAFILSSLEVKSNMLKSEGYEPISGGTQKGDIGLYRANGIVTHAEIYEEGGLTVTDKGGINEQRTGLTPKSNKKYNSGKYSVYRKSGEDIIVATNKGSVQNGVRTVNSAEGKELKKQIKKQAKTK